MRKYAHVDANHKDVSAGLEKMGASVLSMAPLGNGAPDLLAGYDGMNFALEVKNPKAARGKKQGLALTDDEKRFHEQWKGQVHVVTSPEEAVQLVLKLRKDARGG